VQGKYQWIVRILNPLLFALTLAVNYIEGVEKNKTISDKFHLWTTPAGLFFIIWAVIYTTLAITLVYNLVKNVWNIKAHFWFGLSNVFNIFWTFVFDHGELWSIVLASVLIFCIAVSLFCLWLELGNVSFF
jgi:tryptophan-rich sensory protein